MSKSKVAHEDYRAALYHVSERWKCDAGKRVRRPMPERIPHCHTFGNRVGRFVFCAERIAIPHCVVESRSDGLSTNIQDNARIVLPRRICCRAVIKISLGDFEYDWVSRVTEARPVKNCAIGCLGQRREPREIPFTSNVDRQRDGLPLQRRFVES